MPEISQWCLLIALLAVAVLNMTIRARKPPIDATPPRTTPTTVRLPMSPKAAQPVLVETPQPVYVEPEPTRSSGRHRRADA